MLEVGTKAPDFTLNDKHGNPVRLSAFLGKKAVLYFYPKDNTPGCTRQACVFGEEKNGKIIEKGTMCKMARGEMVRFMAQNQITNPKDIKTFDLLDFQYAPEHSGDSNYVFLR